MRRSRAAMRSCGEAAGQRAAELTLRGCRAALMTFTGGHGDARGDMAEARAGLAELHLGEIAAYLALLDALAATLTGDLVAAERAVHDADALVAESGNHWYHAIIHVDLAHVLLAQDRRQEAAEAVARIDVLRGSLRRGVE